MGDRAYTASFAKIYDDIMGTVPYRLWYEYLQEIMDSYQVKAEKVLDLACGTGNMSLLFAKNSYQVTGIDMSREMLTVAEGKARKAGEEIKFISADLREFSTEENYDLAISLFDSLNYILELTDLRKVFTNVYRSLNEDACFIFDVNTISRLANIQTGSTVFNGSGYSCIWEDIVNKEDRLWQVKLKIYLTDTGEYYEEFHQERGYRIADLKKELYDVGFSHVDVYSAYTLTEADDNDNRIYFIAFKNKYRTKKRPLPYRIFKKIKWGVKKITMLGQEFLQSYTSK